MIAQMTLKRRLNSWKKRFRDKKKKNNSKEKQ